MKRAIIQVGGVHTDIGPGDEGESFTTSIITITRENGIGFDLPQIEVEGKDLADMLASLGHSLEQATGGPLLELAATLIQQAGDLVKQHLATEEVPLGC